MHQWIAAAGVQEAVVPFTSTGMTRDILSAMLSPLERELLDGLAEIIVEDMLRQRGREAKGCETPDVVTIASRRAQRQERWRESS